MRLSLLVVLVMGCAPPDTSRPHKQKADPTTTDPDTGTVPGDDDDDDEPDPGARLFDPEILVHEMRIDVDPAATAALLADPTVWVPATLSWGTEVYPDVGLRLKGQGSFQPFDQKPALRIETDKYVEGQEIDGLDELVLNNMVFDPSMVAERTAYALYRAFEVPAPRATHVDLRVNGEVYGLYTAFEGTDGRFLKRWYDDNEGSLYEMTDVDFLAEDIWRFDHDGGPDDRTALFALVDALDAPGRISETAGDVLDIEAFAAYFAVSAYVGQFDAYPYSFPGDDVYLYVDPADGRIDFLPHGADESFQDPDRPADYVFGRLAVACLADPACGDVWEAAIWEVSARAVEIGHTEQALLRRQELDTAILADPRAPFTEQGFADGRVVFEDFLVNRTQRLEDMLSL